jgi:WD40 repeat protein/DNA-binding SARP family transcriptional activator
MAELEQEAPAALEAGDEASYGDDVHVRVLGPVSVLENGVDLPIGGPKQRTAFSLLAARAGEIVATDTLIDGLWGGEPTSGARSTLQTYVSNLRAAIGDVVVRDAGGYRLDVDPRRVDAVQFERAVEDARKRVERDPPHAAQQLKAALALWRGHPYANVSASYPLELEASRLEELRLGAVEARIEAELAMGHHAQLIAELEVLSAEFPLREGFRAQHMLALYRCGRQAEALRAFQKTRTYLAEELGLDPSTQLRELERRILNQNESLLLEPGPRVETLAFLLTDIEDSTVLWETQTAGMRSAVAQHDRVVREVLETAGGRIVKRVGDGIDTVFADVGAAVAAAGEIQRGLAELDWGDTGALLVRMAVDVGEVEARGGDYFGPVLNRAGRILAAAHGGQVLLSADADAALAATESGWQAKALGEYRFKGIGTPVTVFQLLLDGLPSEFPPLRIDRLPPPLPAVAFGRSVRGYELREEVGSGDFGIVYRAYQPSVGREVAIKIIRPELVNQPAFVRRFEAEARLVAQLEHPHIVSLYDYWRDPDGAYLVMRWLRRGSLRQALERGPWNVDTAAGLLAQVTGALSYAHRQGVVHGDLKPANVLLDEEGHAYLSDFGIAARLSDPAEPGRVVTSSPAYVPPEEVAGEPLGPRSDLYNLGLLTFELLAGRRPPMDGALPPLTGLRPELPAALDGVIAKATAANPNDRHESVDAFLAAVTAVLGRAAPAAAEAHTPAENPYKGLRAFDESDADDFFGREALVAELSAAVEERRLVVVVGPSGIGKSSVVKAGLIPALRGGALPGSTSWVVTDMFPGAYPFEELAAALLRVAVTRPAELVEELARDELGMARVVKRALPSDGELLLVVDQFEELFTLTAEDERRRFLEGLTRLVTDGRSRARVVVTLRADFLDHPLRYPELGELVRAGMVAVTVPSDDELAAAIEGPAARVDVRFEPGLVSEIIGDVRDQPGALPLLQYALTELFAARTSDLLMLDGYRATGGVVGALGRRAEELFAGLDARGQAAARQVFLRLVAVDATGQDTRRRVRRRELRHLELDGAVLDELLGRYGQHRLLTFDREPLTRSPTVEVAHEALLDQWGRLRSWIDERREDLLLHRRLAAAVDEWEEADRQPDYLPRAGRLAQFESWAAATDLALTAEERKFLADGRHRDDERRRRTARHRRGILAGFGMAAVLSALLALLALVSRDRAVAEERLATSRELAASAIAVLDRDPELSLLLALRAANVAEPTYEAVSALHVALERHRALWTLAWSPEKKHLFHENPPAPAVWGSLSPDGRLLLVGGADRLEVHDVDRRRRLWERELAEGEWAFARFTKDGSQIVGVVTWDLASAADPPPAARPGIRVWDAATGDEVLHRAAGPCPPRNLKDSGAGVLFQNGPFVDLAHPFVVLTAKRGERRRDCDPETLSVALLDLQTGERTEISELDQSNGGEASISADGRYVALSSVGRVRVVDARTGRAVFDRQLQDGSEARLSADGRSLVTGGGSFGDPLTLWDVRADRILRTFDSGGAQAVGVDFSSDEQLLVSTLSVDGVIRVWDVETGRERQTLRGPLAGVRWTNVSRDAQRLVSVSFEGSVRVWALESRGEVGVRRVGPGAWSADGLHVAGGRAAALRPITQNTAAGVVFDPESGKVEREIEPVTGQMVRLSPDGRRLAAQHAPAEQAYGSVLIHDLESGAATTMEGFCVARPEGNPECREAPAMPFPEWVTSLAFSPDGSLLAAGGVFSGVSVWDSTSGKLLPNSGKIFDGATVAFSPDGSRLVASSGETFVVFDTGTWQELERRSLEEGFLEQLVFTPDGRYLVGGSGASRIVVLDTETWRPTASLAGHQGVVKDVAISPDGNLIASSDSYGLVRIWSLATGEPLQGIPFQTVIQNVAFADDRRLLVTPDEGPAVLVLTTDLQELLGIARDRVTRDLTREECRTYLHVDTCPSD